MPRAGARRVGRVVDVAVVGGGISALWIANLLNRRGLSIAVIEPDGLGGRQTMAAQGIVHSGAKYGGAPVAAALRTMPERWRACLAGTGEVDLRGVRVLADRMRWFVGGAEADPATEDFVLDVPSLVRRLAEPVAGRVIADAVTPGALVRGVAGVDAIELPGGAIVAHTYVFAAGAGNGDLARQAGFAGEVVVERPLRQTLVRTRGRADLYVHWLARGDEAAPLLTVTSHGSLLCVGGRIADEGAARTDAEQVAIVRRLLGQAFPGRVLDRAEFTTFLAVRAEPGVGGARAASDAFLAREGNCLLCLPVKLSLAPRLGDLVVGEIGDLEAAPGTWPGDPRSRPRFAASPYADIADARC